MGIDELLARLESEKRETVPPVPPEFSQGGTCDEPDENADNPLKSDIYEIGIASVPPVPPVPPHNMQSKAQNIIHISPNSCKPAVCFECRHRYPEGDHWKCHQRVELTLFQPRGGVNCTLWESTEDWLETTQNQHSDKNAIPVNEFNTSAQNP